MYKVTIREVEYIQETQGDVTMIVGWHFVREEIYAASHVMLEPTLVRVMTKEKTETINLNHNTRVLVESHHGPV